MSIDIGIVKVGIWRTPGRRIGLELNWSLAARVVFVKLWPISITILFPK